MFSIKILRRAFLILLIVPTTALGQLKLPKLISDGMVLQRNVEVKIWGWANTDESVTVQFLNSNYETVADQEGKWEISLSQMPAGGPYSMTIQAGDTLRINNIMVGEVWVSSGQSNMELPMSRVRPIYESEIAHARNDSIRYFDVPQGYDFNGPRQKLGSGEWETTTSETVLDFSAVAYFFAKKLYQKYNVPVGIINASVGGSPAEAWISERTLEKEFPKYYKEAQRFKDSTYINKIEQKDQRRAEVWYGKLNRKDTGLERGWSEPDIDASSWSTMEIPGYWANADLGAVNGAVWFRKEIDIPAAMAGKSAKLLMGRIVDADSIYVNGTFVGTTSYQYPPRRYEIPKGVLKEGRNTITVRVINVRGHGGFMPDKPYTLSANGHSIDLKGQWKYQLGAKMHPMKSQTFIRWKPLGLYNAMIAPLLSYPIKGVIWYQGESNTDRPVEYHQLFSTLIQDWRKQWDHGSFPFLFVQLANFMKASEQPTNSNWALLREAQRQTLSLPNTGMAVTIDIGEWNDIHPLNKRDVGNRLALSAGKVAYDDQDVIYSGPVYKSMITNGKKVILTFDQTGSGLMTKGGGELQEFAIAGSDCNFVWAEAEIKNNRVIVWSDQVDNPKAVRYAWADNPQNANLYNKEGLPASPFSTMGLEKCQD